MCVRSAQSVCACVVSILYYLYVFVIIAPIHVSLIVLCVCCLGVYVQLLLCLPLLIYFMVRFAVPPADRQPTPAVRDPSYTFHPIPISAGISASSSVVWVLVLALLLPVHLVHFPLMHIWFLLFRCVCKRVVEFPRMF